MRVGAGTLTLLFTDLVGSTESLVALGEDRYDSVRDEHTGLFGRPAIAIRVRHAGRACGSYAPCVQLPARPS